MTALLKELEDLPQQESATRPSGGQLWAVDSWEPGSSQNTAKPSIHHVNYINYAFSPDGSLLTEGIGDGIIRITEVATHRELANLQDPDRDDAESLVFSPDGTKLVTVASGMQLLHVWDLQALDRGLKEAGLDWQVPIAERKSGTDVPPLRVTMRP
jgi:WD40 repeat protein